MPNWAKNTWLADQLLGIPAKPTAADLDDLGNSIRTWGYGLTPGTVITINANGNDLLGGRNLSFTKLEMINNGVLGTPTVHLPNSQQYIQLGDRATLQSWAAGALNLQLGFNTVHHGGVGQKSIVNAGGSMLQLGDQFMSWYKIPLVAAGAVQAPVLGMQVNGNGHMGVNVAPVQNLHVKSNNAYCSFLMETSGAPANCKYWDWITDVTSNTISLRAVNDIYSDAAVAYTIVRTAGSYGIDSHYWYTTAAGEVMRIASDGSVGIDGNPIAKFSVNAANTAPSSEVGAICAYHGSQRLGMGVNDAGGAPGSAYSWIQSTYTGSYGTPLVLNNLGGHIYLGGPGSFVILHTVLSAADDAAAAAAGVPVGALYRTGSTLKVRVV